MQKVIVINEQGLKRVWTDCRPESQADGLMAGSPAGLTCALAEDESLSLVLIVLPGASDAVIDLPVQVVMDLYGQFELHALALAGGQQKVNIRVDVAHPCPDARSNQLIRCVAGGESRIAFEGLIKVQPGAIRTEAFQTSNNLLLSEQAKVRTCPQLEIYADDVKCSHGATTGSLDEDEQFYMRSRGITLEQARLLQLRSFVWPVLAQIEQEELRASCDEQVSRALAEMFPRL